MTNLADLAVVPPFEIWGSSVRARRIQGERITLAVVELAPGAIVPEHTHEAEQLGIVIEGSVTFTIDGETRELGPGGTWRILSTRPHSLVTGADGATVVDVFNPVRDDWDQFPLLEPQPPAWPHPDRR